VVGVERDNCLMGGGTDNLFGFEGSQAVPALPSCKGSLEVGKAFAR
jgi:hypothetical protein